MRGVLPAAFVDAGWGASYDGPTVNGFAGLLSSLLAATRPRQWAKNGIIYVALIFTVNQSWDPGAPREFLDLLLTSTTAFLIFCLLSGRPT